MTQNKTNEAIQVHGDFQPRCLFLNVDFVAAKRKFLRTPLMVLPLHRRNRAMGKLEVPIPPRCHLNQNPFGRLVSDPTASPTQAGGNTNLQTLLSRTCHQERGLISSLSSLS